MLVGAAEILVHANTAGFKQELEAGAAPGLRSLEKESAVAGEASGANLRSGVSKHTSQLEGDLRKHGSAAGSALSAGMAGGLGKVALGLAAAGLGAAAYGIHVAQGMQTAEASIAGAAGTSVASAKLIGDAFLGTAGRTEFSGQEMAKAFAGVAGQLKATEGHALDAKQALQVMSAASDLAAAKQIDLGAATSATAGIMQAFKLKASDAGHVTDVLYQASNATGQGVATLAGQLEKVRSKLGETAGSVGNLAGLLVDMTNQGVTGRSALAALNGAMNTLLAPTKAAAAAQREMGLHVFDASGKFVGMRSVIEQLGPKMAGMTEQQKLLTAHLLFGSSAGRQMLAVLQAGPAAYDRATASVNKHAAAQTAASQQAHTLRGEEATLKAEVGDLAAKIGTVLIPILATLVGAFVKGTTFVLQHKAVLIALAGVVTGILGPAIAVFTINKMAAFGASFVKAGRTLATFAGGMKGTAATVVASDETMVASADTTATGIDTALGATGIGLILVALGVAATEMATHWSNVMANMKTAVNDMVTFADNILNNLIDALNAVVSAFNSTIGQLTGQISTISHVGVGGPFAASGPGGNAQGGNADVGQIRGSAPGLSAQQNQNAGRIMAQLEQGGLSKAGAAALVGNWMQESGLNPGLSGSSGLGLAQWISGRRLSEGAFAGQLHENPYAMPTEVAFALHELHGMPGLLKMLQTTSNPAAAAQAVALQYERPAPATANYSGREQWAQQVYAAFGGAPFGKAGIPAVTGTHVGASAPVPTVPASILAPIAQAVHQVGASTGAGTGTAAAATHAAAVAATRAAATAHKLAAAREALTVRIAAETAAVDEEIARLKAGLRGKHVTAEQKTAAPAEIAELRAALQVQVATQRAALHTQTVQQKVELARQTNDVKAGSVQLNKMLAAIHTGTLASLKTVLRQVHAAGLSTIEKQLDHDHSAALSGLSKQLVAVHTKAMEELAKKVAAAAAKALADALPGKMAAHDKVMADLAKAAADNITDQTKLTLDRQAEAGLTGADLVAARAQTSLDTIIANNNQAIDAAQTVVDQSTRASALAQAQAASALATAQNTATTSQATGQSVLDLAKAAASAASSAATAASTAATAATAVTTPTATAPAPVFNFAIYGNGTLTAGQLFSEAAWALHTGALPVAAPVSPGVPVPA